jgi:hypothetical protein
VESCSALSVTLENAGMPTASGNFVAVTVTCSTLSAITEGVVRTMAAQIPLATAYRPFRSHS